MYMICKIFILPVQDEQLTSAQRLYVCAGLALLGAVIFGILSSLFDKPRDSRLGSE